MFHHNFTGHSILIQSKGNIWLRKLLIPWPAIFRTFLRFLRHWACPGQGNGNGSSIPWCQPTSIIQPAIGRRRVTAWWYSWVPSFHDHMHSNHDRKNRWIMVSIINWNMELSVWLFIMTNLHGTIVSTFSKYSVPPLSRPGGSVVQPLRTWPGFHGGRPWHLGFRQRERPGGFLAGISPVECRVLWGCNHKEGHSGDI